MIIIYTLGLICWLYMTGMYIREKHWVTALVSALFSLIMAWGIYNYPLNIP